MCTMMSVNERDVAVPPMLVYLRLELGQNKIREGQGMSPLTAPVIAQVHASSPHLRSIGA